ncbi:hypothetical protein ILUMI_02505 [Ignelater luminosus]|uniref:Cytochrome P450 n=1 Tax=Ignelater luminosus TaxID=2038154 RepID=A0A8K0DGC6_IGNLU|nr:hypothetical protein ILUMI_02505 [Ignelater luminosus]
MFFPLFLLVVLLLCIFIRKKIKQSFQYWKERGVPHVKAWTIFGNMTSVVFRQKAFANLLQNVYNQYSNQRYFGFYQFLKPTLVIRDIELIKQICIKDFDKFPDHSDFLPEESDPFWKRGLFAMEGKVWHDMRNVLSPAFTSSKMKGMFHLMTECAEKFVDHFENQKSDIITLDMRDALTRLTNDVIASCAFGFKCNSLTQQNNEFYVMGKEAFDFTGFKGLKFFGSSISPALMKVLKVTMFSETVTNFFRKIVQETIAYREKTGLIRPDMIHLLKEAQKGRLSNDIDNKEYSDSDTFKTNENKKTIITDEDIVCQAAIFFFGGYDTVGSLLCNLVYELAINPDAQDKLIEEVDEVLTKCKGKITYEALMKMKYLDMVISETLRLWTPAIFLNRKCVKPFTIEPALPGEKPLHLESGFECMIPTFAIHRDPQYFPNPNKFDPERFSDENKKNIQPFTYLPFGIGPRFCIGNRFALLEAKTGLFYLLTRFKIVPVKKTSVPFVIDRNSIVLRHEHGYWLGLKRRSKVM